VQITIRYGFTYKPWMLSDDKNGIRSRGGAVAWSGAVGESLRGINRAPGSPDIKALQKSVHFPSLLRPDALLPFGSRVGQWESLADLGRPNGRYRVGLCWPVSQGGSCYAPRRVHGTFRQRAATVTRPGPHFASSAGLLPCSTDNP
jgi:hypothetical protein